MAAIAVNVQFIPVGQSTVVNPSSAKASIAMTTDPYTGLTANRGLRAYKAMTADWPTDVPNATTNTGVTMSGNTLLTLTDTTIAQLLFLFGVATPPGSVPPQAASFTVKTRSGVLPAMALAATAQTVPNWSYGITVAPAGGSYFTLAYTGSGAPTVLPYVYMTYSPGTYIPAGSNTAMPDTLAYVEFSDMGTTLPLQLFEAGGSVYVGALQSQNLQLPAVMTPAVVTKPLIGGSGGLQRPVVVTKPLIGGSGGLQRPPAPAPAQTRPVVVPPVVVPPVVKKTALIGGNGGVQKGGVQKGPASAPADKSTDASWQIVSGDALGAGIAAPVAMVAALALVAGIFWYLYTYQLKDTSSIAQSFELTSASTM